MEALKIILLVILILCAICVNLTGNLLRAVIIYLSFSSVMCVVWILLMAPDLAITEAAVGAGVSGILFLLTIRKINETDSGDDVLEGREDTEESE